MNIEGSCYKIFQSTSKENVRITKHSGPKNQDRVNANNIEAHSHPCLHKAYCSLSTNQAWLETFAARVSVDGVIAFFLVPCSFGPVPLCRPSEEQQR